MASLFLLFRKSAIPKDRKYKVQQTKIPINILTEPVAVPKLIPSLYFLHANYGYYKLS